MTSPTDTSHRESLVSQRFGPEAVAYLRNKHTGGMNGGKGVTYEDIFAVVQVAEHASSLHDGSDDVNLHAQVPMYFVDDLVVRGAGNSTTETCFQLKNSPRVAWGQGHKSIADDFQKQLDLSKAIGLSRPEVVLVTSDEACANSLRKTIPVSLSGTAQVRWFPWAETTNLLCQLCPSEMNAIAWLSKHEAPKFQEVSDVLTVMVGIWVSKGRTMGVRGLIEETRRLSPALIRPLFVDDKKLEQALNKDFKPALGAIPGFSYRIAKGFFCWEISFPNGSTQKGVFANDCLSGSFQRFKDRVIRHPPAIFDDIEEELL